MMDFYVAYYPMIVALLQFVILFASYKLWRSGKYKSAAALVFASAVLYIYAAVKIDGTKTKQYHKHSVAERVSEYRETSRNEEIVETKKPTFEERMKAEAERSKAENEQIEKEMLGGKK